MSTPKPSIVIPKGCKPSKGCGTDQTRPLLCHAYLQQRGDDWWVLATNGYFAVAIKVEPGDRTHKLQEGTIPVGALKLMEANPKWDRWQVSKTAWAVETPDGVLTFDVASLKLGEFPDFDTALISMWGPGRGESDEPIGVNAEFLSAIGVALGLTGRRNYAPMIIKRHGHLKGIHVLAGTTPTGDRRAVLMPVRLDDSQLAASDGFGTSEITKPEAVAA